MQKINDLDNDIHWFYDKVIMMFAPFLPNLCSIDIRLELDTSNKYRNKLKYVSNIQIHLTTYIIYEH